MSARYEITVNGIPRSYRASKQLAIEAAGYIKARYPNVQVAIRDQEDGETIVVTSRHAPGKGGLTK